MNECMHSMQPLMMITPSSLYKYVVMPNEHSLLASRAGAIQSHNYYLLQEVLMPRIATNIVFRSKNYR